MDRITEMTMQVIMMGIQAGRSDKIQGTKQVSRDTTIDRNPALTYRDFKAGDATKRQETGEKIRHDNQ